MEHNINTNHISIKHPHNLIKVSGPSFTIESFVSLIQKDNLNCFQGLKE